MGYKCVLTRVQSRLTAFPREQEGASRVGPRGERMPLGSCARGEPSRDAGDLCFLCSSQPSDDEAFFGDIIVTLFLPMNAVLDAENLFRAPLSASRRQGEHVGG